MSKILKNTTLSTVFINDTGVSIPTATQYTIPPQDYLLWAASSDVVTEVGNGDLVVNDGSYDLSISDGIDLIKGLFPSNVTTTASGTIKSEFNEVTSVASATLTTVTTYTAVASDKLVGAFGSGTNIAKYSVFVNSTQLGQFLTHYCDLNGSVQFGQGLPLTVGDIVTIKVLHNRPSLGDFTGQILILGV